MSVCARGKIKMITDIVLDLDETLIHGMPIEPHSVQQIDNMRRSLEYKVMEDQSYIIFLRPGVRQFLNNICARADVSIWTAASQTYGSFIRELLFDRPWRQCKGFFHREHCEASKAATGHMKNLQWLSEKGAPGMFPHYRHMVLVDDRQDIMDSNPSRAIVIDPFVGDPRDGALPATWAFLKTVIAYKK